MAGEERREGARVSGEVESIGIAEARSALAWWLEAGVDAVVQEQPRNWLKPAAPASDAPEQQRELVANVARPSHRTLGELQQWLASSVDLPFTGSTSRRILPHGPENAAVMLLSGVPTVEDGLAGQPIGGEAWELTKRMLTAIGLSADEAYVASLSCIDAPGTKMNEAEREACAEVARQHVRLARPKRLLLFGAGPCLALLGKMLPEARGHVHKVEGVRTIATFHPRQLIKQPSNKSLAWKDLLLLMEDQP
jgi:uracil-DNA glycosylase family 4